ncbi:flagellar biosynthetic protein FliR [Mesorhizobium sp. CAU 1732]|uniref:flagellar biosynthetic protein FliR n=1 Tax=Mesorhizobium sp. CAU 1732 TaxID=3140358 RepID=UPI0032613810
MFAGLPIETLAFAGFLAFCRIGACFMLMPGFSSVRIAMHVRLFVAIAVSWALIAHLWDAILPNIAGTTDRMILLIGSELLIGATIGLVTRIYTLALQFGASAVAMMAGFGGMGGSAVEEPEPQSALTAIITLSALLLLFVFDFHHEILKALVMSYQVAPVAGMFSAQSALIDLTDTVSQSFYLTLRLASPFVAYAILVNLAIGFVNKLAPQIPVYFVSLPFVIAGGLILMYFGIGMMLSLFVDGFIPTTIGR